MLRKFMTDDIDEVLELFYSTVHGVNSRDYSQKQIEAWAPKEQDKNSWATRLLKDYTIVKMSEGKILGFATLTSTGCYDLLYIHKDFQRLGIATELTAAIETEAKSKGLYKITTDASITAKPFFEKQLYHILKEQQVNVRGQFFTNYKMEKLLS